MIFNIIPGYFYFIDDGYLNLYKAKVTGHNVGIQFHERPGFRIQNGEADIYLNISVFIGFLSKLKVNDKEYELEEYSNESRLNIGIGVKF